MQDMSLIDFKQEAQSQGCLHIAVTALDEINSSLYQAVFERLCSLPPVQLGGNVLFLRFIKAEEELPPWVRAVAGKGYKWDEFSAHKQIVGLVGVAQCTDVDDLTNAKAAMRAAGERCKPSFCSRLVVYGPKKRLESCLESGTGVCLVNSPVDQETYVAGDVNASELEEIVKGVTQDVCTKLNARIGQLEKLVGQTGRAETLPVLKSPFESREVLLQDEDASDTRPLSRNHMIARLEKHLGDLYLLTGQLQKASAHYRSSLPSLKSGKDWLWAGSVHEGLSVTAIITKECEEVLGQKAQGADISGTSSIFKKYTHRVNPASGISSFAARNSSTLDSRRKAPAERLASDPNVARLAKYGSARRTPSTRSSPGDIARNESDEGLVMKNLTPPPASPLQLAVVEEDSGLLDIGDEMDGVMESIQYEVEGEGDVEGEGEGEWFIDSRLLQKDFIAKQYSLALFTYRKGGDAGGICQIEALLKFARYLAKQKKTVKAAETLQRILKIDSRLITYQNKVDLYITMAEVYKSMNFKRKAAMFTHYAARTVISNSAMLHANIPDVRNQNLVFQANTLLVNCLDGFKLSSNLEDLPKQTAAHIGWPLLQACVLKDFVFTSRELQKDIEAINHSCYLLQVLHHHLPREELHELTTMLVDIVQEAQDKAKVNPMFAASLKGRLSSPLPLVNFPLVLAFHPKPLVNHLRAYRMKGFTSPVPPEEGEKKAGLLEGPFIYTPIGKKKKDNRLEVVWVEEEPGEIAVEIVNPLPYDLKVEKMTVLLEGVNTEMYPSTLVLPPGEPQSFVLACIPKEPGILSILGYKTVVFGVSNECKVKIPGDPVVRIVPQLPQLRVKVLPSSGLDSSEVTVDPDTSNGMRRKMSRVSIDRLELMDGESCQCKFLLESCKQHIDVESLSVSLKDYNDDYCQFTFDQDHINSLLPITRSKYVNFTVTIQAKIPPWFRIINDATSSFTRKAVGLFDSSSTSLGTPEGSLKSELFFSSNHSTPTSSPTPKRSRAPAHARLPFKVPTKRKSSDSAYSSYTQESMMSLESLDLHIPQKAGQSVSQGNSPTRYHNSLGRGVKLTKPGNKRAFDDVEAALDGVMFNADSKRASVRSDPGDREESKLSRFAFKKDSSSLHSDSKPVAIPKSETATARLSDLSNGASPMFFGGGVGGGGGAVPHPQSVTSGVLFGAEGKTQSLARGLKPPSSKGKWQPTSGSVNTRYISNPIGPLYKENVRPSKVKVVGEFCLEYSGGKGLRDGFCRECKANVQIVVKPVLTFEQFDVCLVEGSQSLFELSFTLTNISKSKLHVTCKVNQDGLIECGGLAEHTRTLDPNTSHKMQIPIKRFVVHEPPNSIKNESRTAKLYSEKLSEIIQFFWQETNKRKRGVIGLDGIRLATSCVSLMRPVPLRFEVTMSGRSFVPKGQNSIIQELKVGEPFKVSLTLINNSGFLMPPSYLVLEPYQFSEELKRIVKDLRGKMIATCSFVNKVQELDPGRFYVHEMTLVFLEKGVFQLDIKSMTPCDDQQQFRASTGSSLEAHSRTGSISETSASRSPIKKASKKGSKYFRPSQQNKDKPSSNRGSQGESSLSVGAVDRSCKDKVAAQNLKNSPSSSKKTKVPARRVVSSSSGVKDDTNRTNFIDGELSGFLPNVAKMVSMIEGKGVIPPPVPTSARPKLAGVGAGGSASPPDRSPAAVASTSNDGSNTSSNGSREKRPYPTITASSALAKPVPLASMNHAASGKPSDSDDIKDGSKVPESPTEAKRLAPQRMESVVLLSSHSRSQNLWNARLQNSNSVKLLSGPHFTFNVT